MTRLRHTRAIRLLSRFCADRTGATAVEFGLVAMPFFTLLFAIMQTSLVMFGSQALQTMTSAGARKIMTGQMKNASFSEFKNALCSSSGMSAMFDCDNVFIQVVSFPDFSAASTQMIVNPKCFKREPQPTAADCWDPGTRQEVVIVRVAYDWPFAVNLDDVSHKTRITAVNASRNEPF
ncbi:pilus biosynthesis protein TadE [Terrihabitans soli]|uniref:Pilus biosynthesis protein TadE n=1 Tax=Terrihabitans soli TaxID=708113 RepID=A0A6S6QZH1_9HYPH|nr:TadE/TadG family type IV pilus assembly protein [Terrihabitans soli]BCJ92038.1 pilus biosynthesis protein TadE [Terrihabitans soli]